MWAARAGLRPAPIAGGLRRAVADFSSVYFFQCRPGLQAWDNFAQMRVVLISTYELGRQPFGLASPAAWLRAAGADVTCVDLSRETLPEDAVRAADLVAFYWPMHTATRLAVAALPAVRGLNPGAHLCFYGLYAPVNESYLRGLGVETILGGEFEEGLRSLAERLGAGKMGAGAKNRQGEPFRERSAPQGEPVISVARQKFITPDRTGMVALEKYARLVMPSGEGRTVGYTEASRGCKHLCRHCPIVPVYNGVFRVVDREVVMADIRQQVSAGARHITFGDPDFFNGVGHAIPLVEGLHREFPDVTYDATIKVEHLLKHSDCIGKLRDTGCLFVTSAVDSGAAADVCAFHAVDYARRLLRIAGSVARAGVGRERGADSAGDSTVDSGGFA